MCFLDLTTYSYVRVIITHKMRSHRLRQSPFSCRPVNPICDRARVPRIRTAASVPCPLTLFQTTMLTARKSSRVPCRGDPENMKCCCRNVIVYRFFQAFFNSITFLFSRNVTRRHTCTITRHFTGTQECRVICTDCRKRVCVCLTLR